MTTPSAGEPSQLKRLRYSHTVVEVPSSDEEDCDKSVDGGMYDTVHTFTHYGMETQSGFARTWGGVVPVTTRSGHTSNHMSGTVADEPELETSGDCFDFSVHLDDDEESAEEGEGDGKQKRPLRPRDIPMQFWLEEREEYLREEMISEGRRGIQTCCAPIYVMSDVAREPCPKAAQYRCRDCDGGALYYRDCIKSGHLMSPLHRIEVWTPTGKGGAEEGFFKSTTLSALGHRIQLGHSPGHRCPLPSPSPHGVFTVIDINGIHTLLVDFCGCHEGSKDHGVQIRQYGWYPATVRAPRSAATIRVLALFQLVSFESKTSTQHFYRAIECLTDNTGLGKIKNLYPAFLNMTHQFGHLKMLKQAGRGNSESGAGGTAEGELALLCPACPQPGINLPNGWQTSIFWFLYILFVGIDANFRLRRKMVSNRHKDPSLSSGSSYFVWNEPFVGFLEEKEAQIEQKKSTCSNHDAVNKHRDGKGLAATGIAAVDCIRHDFKHPCSVVDLQKGERYCNIDYVFASSLRNNPIIHMLVSYDIVCQWNINIPDRFANYPEWMHLDETGLGKKEMWFLVPKFHLPAHILACQTKYSFNYHSHVGRTDGEAVERGWSNLNTLAGSTREMGPGSREDALNNHMGDRNWKKTYGLIALLKRRIKTAVPRAAETCQDIDKFTRALEEHHSVEVKEWDEMLTKWAANPTESVNPFEPTMKGSV